MKGLTHVRRIRHLGVVATPVRHHRTVHVLGSRLPPRPSGRGGSVKGATMTQEQNAPVSGTADERCWMCGGHQWIDKRETDENPWWSDSTGGESGKRWPVYSLHAAPGVFTGELIECPFCKPLAPSSPPLQEGGGWTRIEETDWLGYTDRLVIYRGSHDGRENDWRLPLSLEAAIRAEAERDAEDLIYRYARTADTAEAENRRLQEERDKYRTALLEAANVLEAQRHITEGGAGYAGAVKDNYRAGCGCAVLSGTNGYYVYHYKCRVLRWRALATQAEEGKGG